jgi:hypothetical protein
MGKLLEQKRSSKFNLRQLSSIKKMKKEKF